MKVHRLKSAACGLLLVVLTSVSSGAQDLELNFEFLKVGDTRKALIDALGAPSAETRSHSLGIEHRRLIWLGSNGKKFTASLVGGRLWRWKRCTGSPIDC